MATRVEPDLQPPIDRTSEMDVVLPTCLAQPGVAFHDVDRASILLRSLEKYLDPADRWTIHVLVADGEAEAIRARLDSHRLDLRFHRHSEIMPELDRGSGWRRQQFLKLAASRLVSGGFYLVLDSDQILTRRLAISELIRDGRAMITPEPRDVHAAWWTESAEILGTPPVGEPAVATSCVCLSTALVRGLLDHLNQRYGPEWYVSLLAFTDWVEYSLYYTYATAQGLAPRSHFFGPLLSTEHSVWYRHELESWDVDQAFQGEHYFLCVQSRTDLPPELVWQLVERYLER